ncbi:tRNA pseudouridine(38-40) synthase TruA [Lutibacter sp. HS1-25]|uniref:tRNA pseudouridine(38-40) synthase TruA n=1 Tax=Lutibacter sp. HS1-25 TaxID=2485000 RepID=UPI001010B2E4|nr:tRNA pseudouridine(38-40) synthase TruA [Lutibacter sp. HS1-25]RXP45213.1 tRNA pseudouridine(38-40) synthase TruA [Lutibacter sp. HS1-25]
MRYFIEFAYKGTNYHGWQLQPNAVTVQELLNKAFSVILKEDINVSGAGRTDAGVHASQMYAHFDIENELAIDKIVYKVNALLPNDIVVYDLLKTTDDAHTRFDATSRSYEYRIFLGRNPFEIETTWQHTNKKLNIDKMNAAAEILLTFTNFKCFSRSNSDVTTYNCNVTKAVWVKTDKLLVFHISANRFLRNMVRAIVGTLLDVGTGKTSLEAFEQIIKSENRCNAGPSAPPQGLFLTEIIYPKTIFIHE